MKNKLLKFQEQLEAHLAEMIYPVYVNQVALVVHLHDKKMIDANEYLNTLRSSIKDMAEDKATSALTLNSFNHLADILDDHLKKNGHG